MMDPTIDALCAQLSACSPFPHQAELVPVTEVKALIACAETGHRPELVLVSKPLLRNGNLRRLWQQHWLTVPTRRVDPELYRSLVAQRPARGLAVDPFVLLGASVSLFLACVSRVSSCRFAASPANWPGL